MIQLEVRWVFVLVVGAIFLLLFVGIAEKQTTLQETKTQQDVRTMLESAWTAQHLTLELLEEQEMRHDCGARTITIGQTAASWPISTEVFSPEQSKAQNLKVTSTLFQLPFPIAQMVFLLPEGKQFVVSESKIGREIFAILPEHMTISKEKSPFLFFGVDEDKAVGLLNKSGVLSVVFFDRQDQKWYNREEARYYGAESLVAALVSGNKDRYVCGMTHLLGRMSMGAATYIQKAEVLKETNQECSTEYDQMITFLERMEGTVEEVQELNRVNNQLGEQSCAVIY